jgi:hypothetical protein
VIEASQRLTESVRTIVSFNGNGRDLSEIAALIGVPAAELKIRGHHNDMREIISRIRWPPDPGTAPSTGQCLADTYRNYFG